MKSAFKFAALMLLMVIATGTLLAAITCIPEQKSSMHCGTNCPMMSMTHQVMQQSSANVNGIPCCQISSQPPAPVPSQASPEQPKVLAVLSSASGVSIVPFIQHIRPSNLPNEYHRRKPCAPALLCTFLI